MENLNLTDRWSDASKWVTLSANVGVLIGLIVLIFELRQNAALTRLSHEISRAELGVEIELSLANPAMAEAWMKSITTPETLSDAEIRMVETQLVSIMQQWDNIIEMENAGLVSRARVERHISNIAPFYFGSHFAKTWWEGEQVGWNGTPMYEIAGPIIDGLDTDFLLERYSSLKNLSVHVLAEEPTP